MIIYNPRKVGGNISGFVRKGRVWFLNKNDIRTFPDDVGRDLLSTYTFLRKLDPKKTTAKERKAVSREIKVRKKGGLTDMGLVSRDGFGPEGYVEPAETKPGVDKDGVEWYGEGVAEERL